MDRRPSTTSWLMALAVVGYYAASCRRYWHLVNDDAFITFRYSRMLSAGHGPVYNIGEHVEGYTNFLLMVLLVPFFRVLGPDAVPTVAKLLGVIWGAACLSLIPVLCALLLKGEPRLHDRRWSVGLGAAALCAACPSFALNSVTGLETTLFGMFLIVGVTLMVMGQLDGRWRCAGLAFAGAVLTRPEGSVLFAATFAGMLVHIVWTGGLGAGLWGRCRRIALDGALVTATFLAHALFRHATYGEWLPNTYHAKVGGFWRVSPLRYIDQGIMNPFFGIAGVALAIAGILLAVHKRTILLPLLSAATVGASLPLVTGTDWMPGWRLSMPYLPLVAGVVGLGWAFVVDRLRPGSARWIPFGLLVCAVLLAVYQVRQPRTRMEYEMITLRARGYETGHREIVRWLEDGRVSPGDAIALMDIGIIGYECDEQRIIDISGLTDRFVAKSPGPFLRKKYDPRYILDQAPRYIVITGHMKGSPYGLPDPGERLRPWMPMDHELLNHPLFREHYVRPTPPADGSAVDWKDRFAELIGAARVVEHGHPGLIYLLCVFERQTP